MIDKNLNLELKKGPRNWTTFTIILLMYLGGFGFFIVGVSSYLQKNIFYKTQAIEIVFIPQGILMIFYGCIGILIGSFLLITIIWDVGKGINIYSRKEKLVYIIRQGFPGKNQEICLTYSFNEIEAIELEIRENLNSQQIIYLVLKDNRKIPIQTNQIPVKFSVLETQAIRLSKFLEVKYKPN